MSQGASEAIRERTPGIRSGGVCIGRRSYYES